jgi:O-antigen ligase
MSFKISRFFLYASVFCIALVSTSTLFPFIVGKYTWFRASIDLALIFFLVGIITSGPHAERYLERIKRFSRSPIFIAVTTFVFMFVLAGFLGVDPHNSFWSNFERGEGGLQMLHLYAFFFLLVALFEDEKQWSTLFKCVFAVALLMIGYGVVAGLKPAGIVAIGPTFGDANFRFQGSIGNPAYVAIYLIFVLFYALYLLFTEYREKLKSAGGILLIVAAAVYFVFFIMAATRGAFVGLVAAVLVFLSYVAIASQKWRKKFLILMTSLIFLFALVFAFRNSATIQKLPFTRLLDLSFTTQTFHDRATIWKMAWDGFKEHPILGVGPENFLYVFDHNFNTAYFVPPGQFGAWFDRAHSIIFDYLAETGILGFLSFASIFALFYAGFLRKKNARAGNEERGQADEHLSRFARLPVAARALVFSLPVAYLIQGLVLFDILPSYINLFTFFAFAVYLFASPQTKPEKQS